MAVHKQLKICQYLTWIYQISMNKKWGVKSTVLAKSAFKNNENNSLKTMPSTLYSLDIN